MNHRSSKKTRKTGSKSCSLCRSLAVFVGALFSAGCHAPLLQTSILSTLNTEPIIVAQAEVVAEAQVVPSPKPESEISPTETDLPDGGVEASEDRRGFMEYDSLTKLYDDSYDDSSPSFAAIDNRPERAGAERAGAERAGAELYSELASLKSPLLLGDEYLGSPARPATLAGRLWADQLNFYSPESLTLLGGGLIVGGAMANTSIDQQIHSHFQSSVRGATSDDWFETLHGSKELGNGKYTLPVFAAAWAVGELLPDSEIAEIGGRWGDRSLRGFLVGAPPLIVLQQFTGGSRPTEIAEGSEWHPLHDNNGISGHSFMGSLPFITAAKMTNNRGLKWIYYAGSTIAPLSRVNDNAHYPSQVALGWWMAYLAASAIQATDNPNSRWQFYPYSTSDSSGVIAEFKY